MSRRRGGRALIRPMCGRPRAHARGSPPARAINVQPASCRDPVLFALNIEMPNGGNDAAKREAIAKAILDSINALPARR